MKHTFNAPVHMVDFAPKPYMQKAGGEWVKAIKHALWVAPVLYVITFITLSF